MIQITPSPPSHRPSYPNIPHLRVESDETNTPVGILLLDLFQLVVHCRLNRLQARHEGDVTTLAGQELTFAALVERLEALEARPA